MTLFTSKLGFAAISILYYMTIHRGVVKAETINMARISRAIFGKNDEVAENSFLDTIGLVTKYGYPAEKHRIQTSDGYILTLHRIPKGKKKIKSEHRVPVLIWHGAFTASSIWVSDGPERSLAYILADAGFDVWLGNNRGNCYSREHITLDPDNGEKFWDFNVMELSTIDVPASIDYVLNKTDRPWLHVVCHSQGAFLMFSMLSIVPEYNGKVVVQALAPIFYIDHQDDALAKEINKHMGLVETAIRLTDTYEVFPKSDTFSLFVNLLNKVNPSYVVGVYKDFQSINDKQVDLTHIPLYWSHTFCGMGFKVLQQTFQGLKANQPMMFDYGPRGNMDHYGSSEAPAFNLSAVTAPVYIHYSKTDLSTHYKDVLRLHNELSNSKGIFPVEGKPFSHINFIYGFNSTIAVYRKIIDLMRAHKFD